MLFKKIAIIGAGNSGIGAFKACKEQGFEVVVYERSDQICGMWRYRDEDVDENGASIWRSVTLNTSKEMTAFSDFPPPVDFPNYMHNRHMAEYLNLYSDRIGFRKYVKFNYEIIECKPNCDYEETGKWMLTVRNLQTNHVFTQVFDGVMVCVGYNNKPVTPILKEQHTFEGSIIHSHSYKSSAGFEDKTVVVVGFGNSAVDIAVELSNVCKKVYLSIRTGNWVGNRIGFNGLPIDTCFLRRSWNTLFKLTPNPITSALAERYLNIRFNHKLYGLKPKHRIFSVHPVFNDYLPTKIICGNIIVKGHIEKFTANGLVFKGDSEQTICDAVVLATGYQISFPFLSESLVSISKTDFNLYKSVFHPNLKHPKTLAFIGLALPMGAILPISELQSRWFALLMANKLSLPDKKAMWKGINYRKSYVKKRYACPEKHALECDWISTMDELANIIGVKPKLFKLFITDPKLWRALYFDPCLPYQNRLYGPNRWPKARDAILTANERIRAPLRTRKNSE